MCCDIADAYLSATLDDRERRHNFHKFHKSAPEPEAYDYKNTPSTAEGNKKRSIDFSSVKPVKNR